MGLNAPFFICLKRLFQNMINKRQVSSSLTLIRTPCPSSLVFAFGIAHTLLRFIVDNKARPMPRFYILK